MSHIPQLLSQLESVDLLSKADRKISLEIKKKYNTESTKGLKGIVEANKQALVHNLSKMKDLSIQIIVLEDMIRTREKLKDEQTRKS